MNRTITFGGYTDVELDVDIEDVLASLDDRHIVEEAVDRGLFPIHSINDSINLCESPEQNRRMLCKIFGLNMHTKSEDVINFIKNKINK